MELAGTGFVALLDGAGQSSVCHCFSLVLCRNRGECGSGGGVCGGSDGVCGGGDGVCGGGDGECGCDFGNGEFGGSV